jgi:hypothetical protein
MPRYKVGFDGAWQEAFDDEAEAVEWAEELADTGRVVFVVRRSGLRTTLVAVRPDTPENRKRWQPGRGGRGSPG